MKFWSNLGLVRTLKLGEFKENRSLSFRDIGVRDSRLPNMDSMGHFQVSFRDIGVQIAERHTQYGQYGP